jgi:23S rRNA pseudouridine2605 synthase
LESRIRLAKRIAESGIASRREAEKLIESGHVMVDGQIVKTPAFFVTDTVHVLIDGKDLPLKSKEIVIWKFHKPREVITTKNDPRNRKTVFDFLKDINQRLIYVGRLDYNSEGLLLFTNNGQVARKMELPATGLKRVYRVRVRGNLTSEKIQRLKTGLVIEGVKYRGIDIKVNGTCKGRANFWITAILREGKNREIRKLMEHVGCIVSRLIRISYGSFNLGNLPPGNIQQATPQEIKELLKILEFSFN